MLKSFIRVLGGDPNKRTVEQFTNIVDQVNALEPEFEAFSDETLRAKTEEFRRLIAEQIEGITDEKALKQAIKDALDEILPQAYAAVREASKRTIGLRHFDVQLIGGIALHRGMIAEMRTGEGKTLVATLPLYLNALTGRGVHLITVNDYLARRDARWMAPIYNALGLSVGVLQMAARTENGKKAFLVELDRRSPHEDQDQLCMVPRLEAYAADITYGTNSEFGFDYLRDNMTMHLEDRVQRGHYYAIVDEVDNVLIDEARTPLIISGPAPEDVSWYARMAQIVRQLRPEDYEISERDNTVTLTELGETHVEDLLGMPLGDPDRPEDITHEQARMLGYLEQALRAQHLFKKNKDYIVQASKVVIVDEFTGRLMPGRRWSDGLHQAVEAKEGVRVQEESVTYATITLQNYFRMYEKLAGMSGTALTEAEEFSKIYKLDVLPIPTNLEYQAMRADATLVELEERDDQGYKFHYYAHRDDSERGPIFWRRKDFPDVIYRTEEAKFRAITQEIMAYNARGRPMLVGTTSVELSERLSTRLRAEPLKRLAQTMLLRSIWMAKKNRLEDGRVISELQFLNQPLEQLDIAEMRRLARELEISFNPEDLANLEHLLQLLGIPGTEVERKRLVGLLQAGIPHQVLNARKHDEESQIIAGAGAFGAVTIATNMAGRGVDIKLGGELAEEQLAIINRVLKRAGYQDPYDMSMEQRRQALKALSPADYGIYEAEIQHFLQHMDEMEIVKALGGLHIIGSERHEARRIDNQLRGRSARQGDPGSSRFYLSLQDELMRRFGGDQANALMQRFQVDDAVPMEYGIVSRIVEQSQTRVEGANFDVRKHLLEYDDVLNSQRAAVYAQRNRVFTKDDLSEDVTEMLRLEAQRRVPEALADSEGPWKLLSWLDQIQPTLVFGKVSYPSYTIKLLLEKIRGQWVSDGEQAVTLNRQDITKALMDVAGSALEAEEERILSTIGLLIPQTQERVESQLRERRETVDTFLEGLNLGEEGETGPRSPREMADELTGLLRLPLRLSPDQLRLLQEDPRQIADSLHTQVEMLLTSQAVTRLTGSVERRLEEPLEITEQATLGDWDAIGELISGAVQKIFTRRRERYLGGQGQIMKDLEATLERMGGSLGPAQLLYLLMQIPQGARTTFDKKTHRRVQLRTTRLTYVYYAAALMEGREPDEITGDVLKHLEQAQETIQQMWGLAEWERVATLRPADLEVNAQRGLGQALGDEIYHRVENQPLANLSGEEQRTAILELGRRALTGVYRQLLLGVLTELWVDYLTQMEALRVSIGLEAYAQRDPLVQYKSRASEMFHTLMDNVRQNVVTRMFTYRPRDLSKVQAAVTGGIEAPVSEPEVPSGESPSPQPGETVAQERQIQPGKSKRRRHR